VVCFPILPLVCVVISFSVLSLRAFSRRRLEFTQFMNSNTSSLTMSRYFRLMALATTEILLTIPLAIFTIWLNATASPLGPWRSWEDTHFDYFRVEQIPALFWRSNRLLVIAMDFTRWTAPVCALVFFAFFGFADEAKKNYRKAFSYMAKLFGHQPMKPSNFIDVASIGCVPFFCRCDSVAYQYRSRFKKPKVAQTSSTSSSSLPTYSPPFTSSYPMSDIKRTDSITTQIESLHYSKEKIQNLDSTLETDSTTEEFTPQRGYLPELRLEAFGWSSPLPQELDRRHSSYL